MLPKEFINAVLLNDLKRVTETSAYLSFPLMAISIEFLGKCLDDTQDEWHKGKNKIDFNRAIIKLKAFECLSEKEHDTTEFLYQCLRNGMCHSLIPKMYDGWRIGLSRLDNAPNLISVSNKHLVLQAPEFYKLIERAALEVIDMIDQKKFKADSKMYQHILSGP